MTLKDQFMKMTACVSLAAATMFTAGAADAQNYRHDRQHNRYDRHVPVVDPYRRDHDHRRDYRYDRHREQFNRHRDYRYDRDYRRDPYPVNRLRPALCYTVPVYNGRWDRYENALICPRRLYP